VDGVDNGAGDVVVRDVAGQLGVQVLPRHGLQKQLIFHRSDVIARRGRRRSEKYNLSSLLLYMAIS
jgi:hypothetical protein